MMNVLGIVSLLLFAAGFSAILTRMAMEDSRRRIAEYKKARTYLDLYAKRQRDLDRSKRNVKDRT